VQGVEPELSDEDQRLAAAGDLNVLAILMLVGSTLFAVGNWWIGTLGWIPAALTVTSTLGTSIGLLQRSEVVAAFVKIGFGVSGLVAPIAAVAGVVLGLLGFTWGWAILAGAVVYFGFSLLGLEIISRAEDTGVLARF
jgi:hypothetical protein